MHRTAQLTVLWTTSRSAQLTIDGPTSSDLLDRLDRTLDLLILARARCISVAMTRLRGRDNDVLELLAAVSHRLRRDQGCLHVLGLGHRLASSPEVAAFPEIFGPVHEVP